MRLFRRTKTHGDLDDRTFIVDIYRGILGRDPDEVGMRHFSNLLKNHNLDRVGLIQTILSSSEFKDRIEPGGCLRSEAGDIFVNFQRYQGPGQSGFVTNFLGGLTDVRFVAGTESLSGVVEGYPIPGNFHGDTLEWVGTLRAVLAANSSFTMLELGAGWAPWCVIGYLAAKQRRVEKIRVIAVEGDSGHVTFIRESFAANELSINVGKVIHGVIGASDGQALFPKANNASCVYGGVAAFSDEEQYTGAFADFTAGYSAFIEEVERVPSYSLISLMQDFAHVDLIHCDIQGGEGDFFANTIDLVLAKVKRIVVGTHSFEIERHLACLFAKNDWDLEGIDACEMREESGRPVTVHDGVQVWRNRRF